VISDEDFTRWVPWLKQAGIISSDKLDLGKIYTNDLNGLRSGAS
jgi:hypothetical protein